MREAHRAASIDPGILNDFLHCSRLVRLRGAGVAFSSAGRDP
jgi:hypothetical protein